MNFICQTKQFLSASRVIAMSRYLTTQWRRCSDALCFSVQAQFGMTFYTGTYSGTGLANWLMDNKDRVVTEMNLITVHASCLLNGILLVRLQMSFQ